MSETSHRGKPKKQAVVKKGRIVVSKNGPYLVSGGLPLRKEVAVVGSERAPETWVKGRKYRVGASYRLCRCGRSELKPFCDDTHTRIRFRATDKRHRKSYLSLSQKLAGPGLVLRDAESLCSSARFCYPREGTWQLTIESDDRSKRMLAIRQAGNCPSGRLVAYGKKTGKPIEPKFAPSISLTEDPQKRVSGPIWVKGGVPIESARGKVYELRNRVTLCRCGRSRNKPFCNGNHIKVKFNDGDKSLDK